MNKHIHTAWAALLAATAAAAFAEEAPWELEPAGREPSGWRISAGVRAAPGVKTKATVDGAAALSAAGGRVKPASAGGVPAKSGTSTATSVSETAEDGGTTSSGTTKAQAEATSGYTGAARYDFDDGYIDMEDAAGIPGETTNWHFDSADSFDADALAVSGSKAYEATTVSKTTTKKTTTETTTETKVSDGAARTSFRETFGADPADSTDKDATGFDLQAGRLVYEDADFALELNAGWTVYGDVDCFRAGGRVYEGRATASRGAVETRTTRTTKTDTTETTTTRTESGAVATVIAQPEFTDLADIQNPDGSIGGASYDGLPVRQGWATPVLTVTADRFSVVDRPGESSTTTESATTEGAPATTTATGRTPAASVSRSLAVDVQGRGELSLQELRLGATPLWKAADWLQVRANVGLLGSWAEVETKTTVFANGAAVFAKSGSDDDWKLQGYAGLSLAVAPADWLELSVGAEARFPTRRVRFDDGLVSGSVELAKWDAFAAVGIRF